MPNYILHIPQGRAGRLNTAFYFHNISGLFTRDFSTCSIIVGISQDAQKVILIHADEKTISHFHQIQNEIKWLGTDSEFFLIYRKNQQAISNIDLQYEFAINKITYQLVSVEDEYDGILVTMANHDATGNLLPPEIKKISIHEKPPNLICHPQEQQFLSVTKIEQIIGREFWIKPNDNITEKNILLFDGCTWLPIEAGELDINKSQQLINTHLNQFNSEFPFNDIVATLNVIFTGLLPAGYYSIEHLNEITADVAFWLEGFLNNFDAERLLKRNLLELLNLSSSNSIYAMHPEPSQDDTNYCDKILQALNNNPISCDEIIRLMNEYEKENEQTEFKTILMNEFNKYIKHYQDRNFYQMQTAWHNNKIKEAVNFANREDTTLFNNNTPNLFYEAINLITPHTTKDDPKLCSFYYNAGISLMASNKPNTAIGYLLTAVTLQQEYHSKDIETLTNYEETLKKCRRLANEINPSEENKIPLKI